ncbi:MAG: TonB-dependent receptor [Acidobacteriota bacterium]|nr:TonB-dependent receptor [Acidobacteriota bacterium]
MRSFLRSLLLLGLTAAVLLGLTGAAHAQILGSIQGSIAGENGESLPGVTITVTNQETGATRVTTTGPNGRYSVRSLPSGTYTVKTDLDGLQSTQQENVQLLVGQVIDVNLTLVVEAQAETITVTADSPLVEVSRTSTASYITQDEIESIPIVGRDFKQFALLSPTVADDPQRGFVSMSGQRGVYSGMRVDGTSAKNAFFGYANGGEASENDGLVIGQESVKEFQVIQNGFAPEYGLDGGGFINVITKSGTNDFHGSAFYYFTDDGLKDDIKATPLDLFRDPTVSDITPSEFERTNYGLTAGGPLKRDKAHFFFSYDDTERVNPFIDRFSTRGGYDAVLQRALTEPAFADLVADYTPNNDGIAAPDPINGRTASGLFNRTVDNLILLGKIDLYPSASHSASIRYNYTDYSRTSTFRDEESLKEEAVDAVLGNWVAVTGTQGLNDLRFQYTTDDLNRNNLRVGSPIEALVRFRDRTAGRDQIGKFDYLPIIANTSQFEIRDSYSVLFGDHDLKFGVDYTSDTMEQIFAGSKDGRYDFNSLEDFLNNDADRVRIYFGNVAFPNYDETQDVWAVFAQDQWKPNGNMTLNYGVRWSKTDNPDGLTHIFPQARSIPDDDHLAPRIGFAWQPSDNRTDVFRVGYGHFYGRTPTLLFASQIQENGIFPNFGRVTVRPGETGFVPLGTAIDNENPPATTIPSTSYLVPEFRDARNERFSLGYERELSRNWSAGFDFLQADGDHLQRNYDDNAEFAGHDPFGRPLYTGDVVNPAFNTLFIRRSDGKSEYRAYTLKVTRRFAGNFSLQAHYTYSKDEDDDSNERNATSVTVSDITNPGYDYGLSARDIKNRFVLIGVGQLPLGFKISGTVKIQSGMPWTARDPDSFMPNCPTAVCPAPRAVINGQLVGRNTLRNESWNQVDLRIAWVGDFGSGQVEIFAEAFNLFDEDSYTVNRLFNRDQGPFNVTSSQEPQFFGGAANPEFGIPDERLQQSRAVQFGARVRL